MKRVIKTSLRPVKSATIEGDADGFSVTEYFDDGSQNYETFEPIDCNLQELLEYDVVNYLSAEIKRYINQSHADLQKGEYDLSKYPESIDTDETPTSHYDPFEDMLVFTRQEDDDGVYYTSGNATIDYQNQNKAYEILGNIAKQFDYTI